MKITSVHTILGWFADKLRLEDRRTYHYEKGNDVTIVERRSINVHLYNKQGQVEEPDNSGLKVNQKV